MVRTLVERARAWLRNSWIAQHVMMFMLGLGIGMVGSLVVPAVAHAQLPVDSALANTIGGSLNFWTGVFKRWIKPVLGILMFFGFVGGVFGAATGNGRLMQTLGGLAAGSFIVLILLNWWLG